MRILSKPQGIGGAAALLVVVVVAAWLLTRPHPAPSSEGVLARSQTTVVAESSTPLNDGCFTSSSVQAAGRDSAAHHVYVLTLTLKDDPGSMADLVTTLDRRECAAAIASATGNAEDRLKADRNFGGLAVSYRTSAGARLQLP